VALAKVGAIVENPALLSETSRVEKFLRISTVLLKLDKSESTVC